MANFKRFVLGNNSGPDPVIVIQRVSDGYFWSDGVGFIANSGNPFENAMTEVFDGFWEYATDYEVWANGSYNVMRDPGGAFRPLASIEIISGDTLVGFIEASSITSKNAVTALRTDLQALQGQAIETNSQLGVLADRIDSMNQVLARRDYK